MTEAREVTIPIGLAGGNAAVSRTVRAAGGFLRRSKVAAVGLILVLVMGIAALLAPIVAPYDPLAPDYNAFLQGPSSNHLLGTDQLGRDVLSRLIYGTRISFAVGFGSVLIALLIGVPLGLIGGFWRGIADEIIMRVIDAFYAIPNIMLALAIVAMLGPSLLNLILAIGMTSFPLFARLTRSQVLSLREQDFVLAARAVGSSDARIMLHHILPNALSPLIVQSTLALGFAVLAETGLSYLGVGIAPPTPSWGAMLNEGAPLMERAVWLSTFPGIAIFILVLSFNLVGDGLRDHLDPRLRNRK